MATLNRFSRGKNTSPKDEKNLITTVAANESTLPLSETKNNIKKNLKYVYFYEQPNAVG